MTSSKKTNREIQNFGISRQKRIDNNQIFRQNT